MSTPASEGTHPGHPAASAPRTTTWIPLDPALARTLSDARLQFHHAAQFAAAAGISYLEPRDDDSHTNLGWITPLGALVSHEIPSAGNARVGVVAQTLTVVIVDPDSSVSASFALNGHTIGDAGAWLRDQLARRGAAPNRFTLARHYTIPHHPVDDGKPFDAGGSAPLTELAHWFADGAGLLAEIAATTSGSSPARCWPHHFDIATLIEVGHHTDRAHSIGIGMEPGDESYGEPYLYVTMDPQPDAKSLIMPLAGGGSWHTQGWIGAVLPGSRILSHPTDQEQEIRVFLKSARAACRMLIEGR